MDWLRKRWWLALLVLAITLVIGWEEKRCQTQAYECRSEYSLQLGSIPTDQRASEQQAITAACEPNGYLCRLFGPANLPTVFLVFIGIGGVWAALFTLDVIRKEFVATHRPRLRVRRIMLKNDQKITELSAEITNVGDNSAFIIESHCSIVAASDEIDALTQFGDGNPNNPIPLEEVLSGESISRIVLPFDEPLRTTNFLHAAGKGNLYAIGWVRYRDTNQTIRRTGFFRKREPWSGLFRAAKDAPSDYEYED